ncbi:MAG: hypothetical protein JO026_03385 [Patescibacteria group bacterium]|nr:hypothetical protein [Patescibacteria group bacterium]
MRQNFEPKGMTRNERNRRHIDKVADRIRRRYMVLAAAAGLFGTAVGAAGHAIFESIHSPDSAVSHNSVARSSHVHVSKQTPQFISFAEIQHYIRANDAMTKHHRTHHRPSRLGGNGSFVLEENMPTDLGSLEPDKGPSKGSTPVPYDIPVNIGTEKP